MHGYLGPQEGHRVVNDGQEDAPPSQGHGHLGHLGADEGQEDAPADQGHGHLGAHEGHHVAADGQANMFCRNLPLGQASFVRHHTQTLQCTAYFTLDSSAIHYGAV